MLGNSYINRNTSVDDGCPLFIVSCWMHLCATITICQQIFDLGLANALAQPHPHPRSPGEIIRVKKKFGPDKVCLWTKGSVCGMLAGIRAAVSRHQSRKLFQKLNFHSGVSRATGIYNRVLSTVRAHSFKSDWLLGPILNRKFDILPGSKSRQTRQFERKSATQIYPLLSIQRGSHSFWKHFTLFFCWHTLNLRDDFPTEQ